MRTTTQTAAVVQRTIRGAHLFGAPTRLATTAMLCADGATSAFASSARWLAEIGELALIDRESQIGR
jgi:hypothetical protein